MTERPILFNAEMVRAILDGNGLMREQLIERLQRENEQLTSDLIRERQRVVQLEDRLSEVDMPIPFTVALKGE